MGGISEYGILNCNHGVLRTELLKSVGYFNERYHSYTIDPDLTVSVLSTGRTVVMTKRIAVLHHRAWAEKEGYERVQRAMKGIDNARIYHEKFRFLEPQTTFHSRLKNSIWTFFVLGLSRILFPRADLAWFGMNRQDFRNILLGRFIRLRDRWDSLSRPYHLVQRIPRNVLLLDSNPYRHLVDVAGPVNRPARSSTSRR